MEVAFRKFEPDTNPHSCTQEPTESLVMEYRCHFRRFLPTTTISSQKINNIERIKEGYKSVPSKSSVNIFLTLKMFLKGIQTTLKFDPFITPDILRFSYTRMKSPSSNLPRTHIPENEIANSSVTTMLNE